MRVEIHNVDESNKNKRNTNNGLRHTFKKMVEEIDMLNKEHILKVEESKLIFR